MARISLREIDKYYDKTKVLDHIDLDIEDGDFMTLLGPSGCGKTTTLRIIAGLEEPQRGTLHIDGAEFANAATRHFEPSSKRNLNLVFQSYALWPHMTVMENITFGLRYGRGGKKRDKETIFSDAKQALERMQIQQFGDRYPSELSGGQQQRVAIARSIAGSPGILLLDEPLSNLDAKLRIEMRAELKRLHRELGTTIVYVTHDQTEALTMSTKIAVFSSGHIVQIATPGEVYNNPATLFVADFIGNPKINFLDGVCRMAEDGLSVETPLKTFFFDAENLRRDRIPDGEFRGRLAIRPEHIDISERETPGGIMANVYSDMPAGSETLVQVTAGEHSFTAKMMGQRTFGYDRPVYIQLNESAINVYNTENSMLIRDI